MQVAQDIFIQKKLLYKFDKKIEVLFQSLFINSQTSNQQDNTKMVDETQENAKNNKFLTKQALLQEIEQLKFQNFKYRTALISAKKDQTYNQQILKNAEEQIFDSKRQVQSLSKELEYSLKCKKNKEDYNQLAQSLKSTFEPLAVQNQKIEILSKEIQQMEHRYEKQLMDYEKKQKCLKLALSALKCVIDTEDLQNNGESMKSADSMKLANDFQQKESASMINQSKPSAVQAKFSASLLNSDPKSGVNGYHNCPGREQGEQLEGGQILY